jgi:hypothetical protein
VLVDAPEALVVVDLDKYYNAVRHQRYIPNTQTDVKISSNGPLMEHVHLDTKRVLVRESYCCYTKKNLLNQFRLIGKVGTYKV